MGTKKLHCHKQQLNLGNSEIYYAQCRAVHINDPNKLLLFHGLAILPYRKFALIKIKHV